MILVVKLTAAVIALAMPAAIIKVLILMAKMQL